MIRHIIYTNARLHLAKYGVYYVEIYFHKSRHVYITKKFHYKPGHNKACYIKFISAKSIKPKETKPKEVWCDKCNTPITYMTEFQRLTHNKLHQHQESNQTQLFKFF